MFNNLSLSSGLTISCRTKEIHCTPKVTLPSGKSPELGDYFVNIKYMDQGAILGHKMIIHQVKRADRNQGWSTDPHQLELLSHWPRFTFGKKQIGYWSFNLSPVSGDLGCYLLGEALPSNPSPPWGDYDFLLSAVEVDTVFGNSRIQKAQVSKFPNWCGTCSLLQHLLWRRGELMESNPDLADFMHALYRYVGWNVDPPDEFDDFTTTEGEEFHFWAAEITVSTEAMS